MICSEPVKPSWSVAEAVIVWLPSESARVIVAPVPRLPSRLDCQWTDAPRSPSTVSVAVAWRVTMSPVKYRELVGGWTMWTVGADEVPTVRTRVGFCPLVLRLEL